MKKIMSIMLAVMMLAVMTACGEKTENLTPYEQYMKASQSLDGADSYQMKMDVGMNVTVLEQTMEIAMGYDMKLQKQDEAVLAQMAQKVSMNGVEQEGEVFYKDGYLYDSTSKSKAKQDLSVLGMMDMMKPVQTEDGAAAAADEFIKDQKVEKEGENQKFTFVLDGAKMQELMQEDIGGLTNSFGVDSASMTISDITLVAVLGADGALQTTDMQFSFDMEIEGQTANMAMTLHMDVTQVGGVTVEFPEDLDSYEEYVS